MKISVCKFPEFEDCRYSYGSGRMCQKCRMYHKIPKNYSVAGNLCNAGRRGT